GDRNVVVDLRLPPRRNRARILAAAVVVAVLAVGLGAVVARSGDDGEPVIADSPATPTGWYLPGPGWEVVGVSASGTMRQPGLVRDVTFTPTDSEVGFPQATARVLRTTDPAAVIAELVPAGGSVITRGTGAEGRTYRASLLEGGSAPSITMAATRGDDVLIFDAWGMELDEVVALADRWWTTEPGDIPTPAGQARWGDTTYVDVAPASAEDVVAHRQAEPVPIGLAVNVEVRSPAGEQTGYSLQAPTPVVRPTGADGVRSGLREDELPRALPTPPSGGEAWVSGSLGEVLALLPGARVGVYDGGEEVTAALVESLRPVSAATWAEAIRAVEADPDPALLSPTLAGAPVPDLDESSGTTMADDGAEADGGTEQPSTTVVTTPLPELSPTTTAPAPADGTEAGGVRDAFDALVDDAGPVVRPGAFADEVTVGFVGTTDADVVLGADDLLDPARWRLELGGRWAQVGPASALERLAAHEVTAQHPAPPDPGCAGATPGPVEDTLFAFVPADIDSCLDWFAVVVRVDDEGRITEVRLRLWEP
ncbi:MAG TPA: hypothetical protein VK507_18650, partial [Iamia sp.]|nr:hypothetical protein [Iamia sp.]